MSFFPTQETVVPGIIADLHFADTIILKNIQATGKIVRNAETPLKPRYTSIMEQMNTTSRSLKILPPTYLPNVQDAVSLYLWDMTVIQSKETNTFVKSVLTRKWRVPFAEQNIESP